MITAVTYRGVKLWRSVARKHAVCWRCGRSVAPGAVAYRPLDNSPERWRRLDEHCAIQLYAAGGPSL